jgi:hypothetical protein
MEHKDTNNNAAVEVIQTVVVTDNQKPVIASNGNKKCKYRFE